MKEIRLVLSLAKGNWLRFEVEGEVWLAKGSERDREPPIFRMEKRGNGWYCSTWVEVLLLLEPKRHGMVTFYDHLLYLLISAYLNHEYPDQKTRASRLEELKSLGRNYPRISEALRNKPLS